MVFLFGSIQSVSAHDGGHRGCYAGGSNDCPPGHSASQPFPNNCPWTDPECATRAVDGCDVRNLDATSFPGGNFPNGINVCASNRIINCNQNQLTGSGTFFSVGIIISSASNVAIRNCRITNYDTGARTWQSYSGGEFKGNTFSNNRMYDIFLQPPASSVNIYENNFRNSYQGIVVSSANNINITRNTFSLLSNALVGVGLLRSSNNLVEKNSFSGGGIAISTSSLLSPANNNIIKENTISGTSPFGVIVVDGNYNNITKNMITGGGISIGGMFAPGNYNFIESNNITGGAVSLAGRLGSPSTSNIIRANTINDSVSVPGISVSYSSNNIVDRNTLLNNIGGIAIDANSNNVTMNRIVGGSLGITVGTMFGSSTGNYLLLNTVVNASSGIFLWNAHGNVLRNNTLENNAFSGLYVLESTNNVIKANKMISGGANGIRASRSSLNNITWNSITDNGKSNISGPQLGGIQLVESTNNVISHNIIIDNNEAGISMIQNSDGNKVQNNTIANSTVYGIYIWNTANESIDGNYVCQNGMLDFFVDNSTGNNGTRNICDRPDGWNDIGTLGCTYRCRQLWPGGVWDFGDAPDPPYTSLFRNNGARHSAIGYEILGTRVSADIDANVPNLDEFDDGIVFPVLRPFSPVTLNVTVTVFDKNSQWYLRPIFLSGWFDWNNDGIWSLNEKAFSLQLNASTFSNNTEIIPITFVTPFVQNMAWARIRLSYGAEADVTGGMLFGEVEDYPVNVSTAPFLTIQGTPRLNTTVNISLADVLHPSTSYVLAMSLGATPGITLPDGRVIPLNPDILFLLSIQIPSAVGLFNNIGTLDTQGRAQATLSIPNMPPLAGTTFYLAFVTIISQPNPIASISGAVPVRITQ